MSIPTPTANPLPEVAGGFPGLPDEATLARLAGDFLRALPGGSPPEPGLGWPSAPPSPGVGGLALGEPGPALQPVATPAAGQPPVEAGPLAPEFGVPEAYAAALPAVTPPPTPAGVPASPYYFVGETQALSAAHNPPEGLDNRIVAHPFELPGDAGLRRILGELAGERSAPAQTAPQAPGHSGYYFIEPALPTAIPKADATRYPAFDVHAIRRDFPILAERVNGKPLIWFDNAATTHKPQAVIDRLVQFYSHENSNIHRAAHELAARSTDAYEAARSKVARFIGAASPEEIIFVRGATEAINLVAKT